MLYIPRKNYRYIIPSNYRNSYWESWGRKAEFIGYSLILFGALLSICEIVRIYNGPTNRGITNDDTNDNTRFPIGNISLLFPVHNDYSYPARVEKFHYWPWTYAANLFGLVLIISGVVGVISAYRRSYSSIFSFLTLNILSIFFCGYLIGYYSILIYYYTNQGLNKSENRPDTMDTSFGLAGTNLAFSCFSCLISIFGAFTSFYTINGCNPKGERFLIVYY